MKAYKTNIPDGMRDGVYEEIRAAKLLGEALLSLYKKRGYAEVVTPTVEFFDVFNVKNQVIPEENMFKLTDKSGRLVVLRPDNTTPMARIASTRLKNAPRPVKLCYDQKVFRMPNGYSGVRSEFEQTGVEIIGGDRFKSDLECLTLAIESLKQLNACMGGAQTGAFRLEIGHAGFASALVNSLALDASEKELALDYVAAKNALAMDFLKERHENMETVIRLLRKIPRLFGGKEVLDKARELCENVPEAEEALDYLLCVYNALEKAGFADAVLIDLSIVHEMEYYTGLVFRGYIENIGEAVLGGGRYDTLLENFGTASPATGFGVNISAPADRLAKAASTEQRTECLVCYEPQDLASALAYIEKSDKICELSCLDSFEENLAYAADKKIACVVRICDTNTVQITQLKG